MLAPGTRLGAYEVMSLLGAGGMGEVYRAKDTKLGREIAIKVLPDRLASDEDRLARFQREAQVLASLNHPHIAAIYGLEESNGLRGLILELVEGDTLADRLASGPIASDEALAIAKQIAEALEAAHGQGIIHRDLKPANIKIARDGVVKVLDFGLAKSRVPAAASSFASTPLHARQVTVPIVNGDDVTRTVARREATGPSSLEMTAFETMDGAIMGTAAYMSPEQASGGIATSASDMYSFGLLLQELATGRPPYDRALGYEALIEKARTGDTVPVTGIDADLGALIRRLKSVAPARRPTAVETIARLQWIRDKPRRRVIRLAGAAAIILLAIGVAKYTIDLARERDRANREAQVSQQVTNFLTGLFRVADPSESRGKSVTARELLDAGARQIDASLRDQPEVQARLMQTIGATFDGLGLYSEAQKQLERALETHRRVLGPEHPETLRAMSTLAAVYVRRQQYEPALKLYEETMDVQLRALGPEHPDRLAVMQDLGWLIGRQGRHAEGEKLVLEALAAERRLLGNEHPNTLLGMNRLANIMTWQGRHADREKLLREELEVRRRVQGSDHPSTIGAMRLLATAISSQGQLAEAERLVRDVLDVTARVLGPDHPTTAAAMTDLGLILTRQKHEAEAEPVYLAAIDIYQRALGAESDSTLLAMNNLGLSYLNSRRDREAEELFRPLLATSRRVRGREHQRTLMIMNNLALVYANKRQHDEATSLLRETIAIARRTLGEEHPDTVIYIVSLAEVMAHRGQHEEALKSLREAVDHGYRDADQIASDEYFVSLRADPKFRALLNEIRQR